MADSNSFSFFFLGLGVGVAAGILFAPKSGEETREDILAKAEEGKEYVRQRGSNLRDSAEDMVERGKDVIGRQKDQLSAAVDAGKQAYRETVGEVPGAAPLPR